MPKLSRTIQLALVAVASFLVMVVLAFVLARAVNGGEVLGGVTVAGIDLGGLGEEAARERLQELERDLRATTIPVIIGPAQFDLPLSDIEYSLDTDAIIEDSLANGRTGNVLGQFAWWLRDLVSPPVAIPLTYQYDPAALDHLLRGWEVDVLANPPFPGEVIVVDDNVTFRYPAVGTGIDREAAVALISESLGLADRPPLTLPMTILEPAVTTDDVDLAVATTNELLASPVTLRNEETAREVVVPREVLGRALIITIDETALDPEFVFALDPEPLLDYLDGFTEYLTTTPVDAVIDIDIETDVVTLVPSIPIYELDRAALADAAWEAMVSADRIGTLPFSVKEEAAFSTAAAEALGIKELIGEFTTFHACCQRRVINIQLMASIVDGALVLPGEEFSLNDYVGRRTTARGFVCAGALVGGEIVEEGDVCIGGGTSQFTTTLHNAVFFSGLEHIEFTPHSAWFSRYPEGREATIGWREPEYIFKNNTANAIIIRTVAEPDSITVKIYGDNGGLEVEAGLSDRFNFSGIRETVRVNDEMTTPDACDPATAVIIQAGVGGWSVTVFRHITHPDGTETTESWNWHYTGLFRIKEYNPATCVVVDPPPPDP